MSITIAITKIAETQFCSARLSFPYHANFTALKGLISSVNKVKHWENKRRPRRSKLVRFPNPLAFVRRGPCQIQTRSKNQSHPSPQVRWYRDSNLLAETDTVSFQTQQNRHTLILRWRLRHHQHRVISFLTMIYIYEGEYKCRASQCMTGTQSFSVSLGALPNIRLKHNILNIPIGDIGLKFL